MIVTAHSAHRWIERVDPAATFEEARAAIATHARAVAAAAKIGRKCVRLGCGARLVLDGETVTTVLGPAQGRLIEMMARPGYSIEGRAL